MPKPVDMAALVARAEAKRLRWVELEPGKRVQVRRPGVVEGITLAAAESGMARYQAYAQCVAGWEGITERDVLVSEGSDEPLAFSLELWRVLWSDRPDWLVAVVEAVNELQTAYMAEREEAAKNSRPS